jgi:two-component system chemotaxis sensor kinase CheA
VSSSSSDAGSFGDTSDFRAIFFEEADEHVAAIEGILLGLNIAAPEAEELNAIFRAAHSIKGTSGMLGFAEISALTHVLESLLDDLRKGERPLTEEILDLMLRAGDMVKMQVAHRRGTLPDAPDAAALVNELRALAEQPAQPGAGTGRAARRFAVCLGPLAAPVDTVDLDLMLSGLADMGRVTPGEMRNAPGGEIRFEVELEGAEADLRSVLALVVPEDAIHIARQGEPAPAAEPPPPSAAAADDDDGGEIFVDPAKWKAQQKKAAAAADAERATAAPAAAVPAAAPATQSSYDEFVTPEALRAARATAEGAGAARPRSPGRRASDDPAATVVQYGRRASDSPTGPGPMGRRGEDRRLPGAAADAASIRVGIDKVDRLVNLVGELVITEAMLAQQLRVDGKDSAYTAGLVDLGRHARNLQEAVMSIRMVPISAVFTRFPRVARELAQRFGKEVELKVSGETTELDRGLIEKIIDPLTHLVRNSIDHGIETAEARVALGKPRWGTIVLSASQRGGNIVIQVQDDGAGLNRQKILERAAERGIAISPQASDEEVWQLIFEAGFSTAEKVTDVSGRGVGMDVVRRNIQVMGGGTVELSSTAGAGMTVTVSVPLTLAIMESMSVAVGSHTYVLPLTAVIESRRVEPGDLAGVAGQGWTLRIRDDFLPVLWLSDLFASADAADRRKAEGVAVIVESEAGRVALMVDNLLGQQQVVVKSLEANFRRVPGISSATIMGDGRVALILDISQLVQLAHRRGARKTASGLG